MFAVCLIPFRPSVRIKNKSIQYKTGYWSKKNVYIEKKNIFSTNPVPDRVSQRVFSLRCFRGFGKKSNFKIHRVHERLRDWRDGMRVATSQLGTIMLFCFIVVPRPPNKTNTMRSFSPRGFSYSPFSHSVLSAPRSWRVSINTHPSTSTKFSMILISI